MAGWNPNWQVPPVPGAVDMPFPGDFGPPSPQPLEVMGATAPAPQAIPPWQPQFVPPPDLAGEGPYGVPGVVEPAPGVPQEASPLATMAPPQQDELMPFPEEMAPPDAISGGQLPDQRAPGLDFPDPEAEAMARIYANKSAMEDTQATGEQGAALAYDKRVQQAAEQDARDRQTEELATADTKAAIEEARAARVDPQHYWTTRSTGQKILTVIGAALGGFLQSRQGLKSNPFLDSIEQAIQDDIRSQEANMANARAGAQMKAGLLSDMSQRFRSQSAARYATASLMYDATMRMTAAEVSKFRSPITREEGKLALVQLQKGRDANAAAAAQSEFDARLKLDEQARKDAETQANILKTRAETAKIGREGRGEVPGVGKEVPGKGFPIYGQQGPAGGAIGYARDKEKAGKAEDQIAAMGELDALYARGKELLKNDYAVTGSNRRLQIEQWNSAWQNARFRASGRTDAPSAGEMTKWGIDPGRILGDNNASLDESYRTAKRSATPKLRQAGVPDDQLFGLGLGEFEPGGIAGEEPQPGDRTIITPKVERGVKYDPNAAPNESVQNFELPKTESKPKADLSTPGINVPDPFASPPPKPKTKKKAKRKKGGDY